MPSEQSFDRLMRDALMVRPASKLRARKLTTSGKHQAPLLQRAVGNPTPQHLDRVGVKHGAP